MISIIVPVYKVEKYINRCVESIVNQSIYDIEIILIDDGSSDKCTEICDDWATKDKRIKVIHKKNGGLSDARNEGFFIASGEYIGFVDSDDWIAPEMYKRLLEAIERDHSDISACSVQMVWEDSDKTELLTKSMNKVLSRREAQKELLFESDLLNPVWYKLYKKQVVDNVLFEVGKQHEDVYWSYQVIGKAEKVSIIDYIGYYYSQRDDSIMGENYSVKRLDIIPALIKRQNYFEKFFPELILDGKINIWYNCMFHGQQILLHIKDNTTKKIMFKEFKKILSVHSLSRNDLKRLNTAQRIWMYLEGKSLLCTCKIRNIIGIGY